MSNEQQRAALGTLTQALLAAGIPIAGVGLAEEGFRIDFLPEATADHQQQAAEIVAGRDWNANPRAGYDAAVAAGYPVQPEGFTLRLGDQDRLLFSQLSSWMREALEVGAITETTEMPIADDTGTLRSVPVARLRQILVEYGAYYMALWQHLVATGG